MHQDPNTRVTNVKLRQRRSALHIQKASEEEKIDWHQPLKHRRGEDFLRNLTVAAALVLCAVTLRTGAIPQLKPTTDMIMTAATDHSLLDDQLGKLSFVSSLFPEAVLVFGKNAMEQLAMPVGAGVVTHVWSEQEPYMSWQTSEHEVTASAAGEVVGVYHGVGDEWIIQISNDEGVSCIYGNLEQVAVQTGDAIAIGDVIGTLQSSGELALEVFNDGISVDPAVLFAQ